MILIKNAEVYAPQYLGKKDILLSYDRILQVDDHIDRSLPNVTIIEAAGKIVTPGFIDQHVHIIGGGGECGLHSRTPELRFSHAVESGVTTLVGMLGTDGYTRSIESLVAKTKALNNEGITAYCLTGSYQLPSPTLTGSVAKDIIYLNEVIGCKLACSDHRSSHPTRQDLISLLSEVRTAGLVSGKPGMLVVHIGPFQAGIEPLLDIIRTTDIPIRHVRPTHMGRHPKQAMELMNLGGYADFTASKKLPAILKDMWNDVDRSFMTVSSDSNGSAPIWNEDHTAPIGIGIGKMTSLFQCIRDLVKLGIPFGEALPLITSNVAQALEIYPRKGLISAGSDADLCLMDRDLELQTVIAKGQVLMQDKKILVRGMFEE